MGEGQSQAKKGAAQQVMAALRNTSLALLRKDGVDIAAVGIRKIAWQPGATHKPLGIANG